MFYLPSPRARIQSLCYRLGYHRKEEETKDEDAKVEPEEKSAERSRRTLKGFSPVWVRMCRLRCPEPLAA